MASSTNGGSATQPTRLRQIALVVKDLERAEYLIVSLLISMLNFRCSVFLSTD